MQPYPTVWKPILLRHSWSPLFYKYSVTTFEPGDNEVLTYSGTDSPFSIAFFANNPAAINTNGLLVLVQEVIAAINSVPFYKVYLPHLTVLEMVSFLTS